MLHAATVPSDRERRVPSPSATAPPVHLTGLIGRADLVRGVRELLDASRLVTLTGVGGCGKTRLACEVAVGFALREGEVCAWTELAPLREPALLTHHVMAALGFSEGLGEGGSRLVEMIADRPVLLVLDNCEHLVDACATLVNDLLRSCAALRILATSREALAVPGEHAVLVPPLSVPPATSLPTAGLVLESEAAVLFLERARAVLPSFEITDRTAPAVAQLCRRLDGLPLAIELAAARVKVLGVEQIADRLDHRFQLLVGGTRTAIPRHKTLRAAIDWSYELLSEGERLLLRRLSIFAGGFTLETVERVCVDPEGDPDVLTTLTALVDKSLVVAELALAGARYRLLETVRELAFEYLRLSGDEARVRERHAAHFLELARAAEGPTFGGASQPQWIELLEAEEGNLRLAADWYGERPERAADALHLATALHWFWFARGRFREARRRLESAFAMTGVVDPLSRGRALAALGHVAIWQGEGLAARAAFDESVPLLRAAGDAMWLAYALAGVGAAAARTGRATEATAVLDEAVALARTVDVKVLLPFALYWRGIVAELSDDDARARAAFEEAVAVARERQHKPSIGHTLYALGRYAWRDGDRARALGHYAGSLAALNETGDRWGMVNVVEELARAAAAEDRPQRVAMLLGAAETLRNEMGVAIPAALREVRDRLVGSAQSALGPQGFDQAWIAGRALSVDELLAILDAEVHVEPPGRASDRPGVTTAEHEQLRVWALGPLLVERGGEALGPRAWRSARAKELLVFLLCHPNGCTRDQIGLALWPDASPAQVRDNVHVTLHRLRHALGGRDWVVLTGERYRIAGQDRCEFDVAHFELEAKAGRRDLEAGAGTARLEAAVALYRGDFLEHENAGDWHQEHRGRLQLLYLDALRALGDSHLTAQRYQEATDAYRRLLARDPLHEPAHRGLMISHAAMGEHAAAQRVYRALADTLRADLGGDPDPATTALAERLRAGAPIQSLHP